MFVPVQIRVGAGGDEGVSYERGIDLVGQRLVAFNLRSGDMTVPLARIGQSLRDMVAGQFTGQGAAGATGRWAPLSEAYAAWKESHVPGLPLLVGIRRTGQKGERPQTYAQSGRMRMELLDPLATHVSAHRLLYAPTSEIAGYHETGTSKMPARPPVDLRLTDLRVFDRIFVEWLAAIVKEAGL